MRDRAATLARFSALERFREERSRQQLAAAHAAAQAARAEKDRDEAALDAAERAREAALHHGAADMARYALYADCAMTAEAMLALSTYAMDRSEAELQRASWQWALARARRDMADERAVDAREEAERVADARTAVDMMDMWLARQTPT